MEYHGYLPDIMDMPHHRRMRAWTLIQKI
jgi:hypothetical protein